MTSGIYEIVNLVTGGRYVGHSKQIEWRWYEHRRDLTNGCHHNLLLQRAWNKYSSQSFAFRVVEECRESQLLKREQVYIDLYWDVPDALYNLAREARKPPGMSGRTHSEVTREKISQKARGRHPNEETRSKMSESHKGKKHTPEAIDKISAASRSRKYSDETRAKRSASLKGRTFSEEWRKKLSSAKMGNRPSPETIAKRNATRKKNQDAKRQGDKNHGT